MKGNRRNIRGARPWRRSAALAAGCAAFVSAGIAQAGPERISLSSAVLHPHALSSMGLYVDDRSLPQPWWLRTDSIEADYSGSYGDLADGARYLFTTRNAFQRGIALGNHTSRWSINSRAARFGGDGDTRAAWSGVSFDFKRQLLSPDTRGSLALGFGWALIDADDGTVASPRISLEGHIGINKRWSLYGQSAWLADMGRFSDGLGGDSIEAGLYWRPTDSLSLRAGLRRHRVRLGNVARDEDTATNSVIFGAGWRW